VVAGLEGEGDSTPHAFEDLQGDLGLGFPLELLLGMGIAGGRRPGRCAQCQGTRLLPSSLLGLVSKLVLISTALFDFQGVVKPEFSQGRFDLIHQNRRNPFLRSDLKANA
jgi:hypothetical protein